jgi:aryl-alcohol dehydrogenase-like predicted oxidoreductase
MAQIKIGVLLHSLLKEIQELITVVWSIRRRSSFLQIGPVSPAPAWKITKALGLRNLVRFDKLQAYYSIAGRDLEREIVPLLGSEKVGLLVWSPLAGGLLSGKFSRTNQKGRGFAPH